MTGVKNEPQIQVYSSQDMPHVIWIVYVVKGVVTWTVDWCLISIYDTIRGCALGTKPMAYCKVLSWQLRIYHGQLLPHFKILERTDV